MQRAKSEVLAHFVGDNSASKLPLIFVKDETWLAWEEVFDAWDNGELIREDGRDPGLIPRKPRFPITKTDLAPTLGLRDADLVTLAREVLDLRVAIKTNQSTKDRRTLMEWCKDVKMDRIIMNELMYKLKGYRLPCKDADWVPYTDAAWNELAGSMHITPAIVRNIWTVVNKVTDGHAWLTGRANALHPSTDKSKDGVAPEIFNRTVAEFTTVTIDSGRFSGVKLFYDCLHAETITDVKATLEGVSAVVDLTASSPKLFAVFGFSPAGDPLAISKHDVLAIANLAEFRRPDPDEDLMEEGDDEEPTPAPAIPVPMLWIGNSRWRDTVMVVSRLKDSTWTSQTVYYQPHPRAGFKKSELESKPMVALSLTYPKPVPDSDPVNDFKDFTGIKKPLDWYQESAEADIDWNAGHCGVDHRLLEQLLKPTVKDTAVTVINVWGGGNITEIAMVSSPFYHLCT